jgi:hypothetical protein
VATTADRWQAFGAVDSGKVSRFAELSRYNNGPNFFWNITPCSPLKISLHIGKIVCLYLQRTIISRETLTTALIT